FRKDGLFDKHQLELFKRLGETLCHWPVHPAMKIDRNPEVLSDRLADRSNALNDFVHARRGIYVMELGARVHLDRPVALGLSLLCSTCDFARTIAANPGIDMDSVTHSAAEQLVSRKTV